MEVVIQAIVAGVIATIAIDIWATFANKILMWPRTNWAMVGRWVGHISRGKFKHDQISLAQPIENESVIGWGFHYLVGVLYAFLYFAYVFLVLDGVPTLVSALVFGVVTVLSPWFLMQPGLGLGICAVKAPRANLIRLQNFIIHSLFGIALYFGWLFITGYS
jgi:Protein of unknown function (DUF2938)